MGLDMFLSGVNYVRPKMNDIDQKTRIIHTREVYWRKANHIHKWFVDNVQNGEDDCLTHTFEEELLIELRDTCNKVLEYPERADELLPTYSGPYFGDTAYDEWYFEETERTALEIDDVLKNGDYDYYSYMSSW